MPDDVRTEELVATENFTIWLSYEPDGETIYHLELGQVTAHLFSEEWNELLDLMRRVGGRPSEDDLITENFAVSLPEPGAADDEMYYDLELAQATLHFLPEDWAELNALLEAGREAANQRR